MRNKKKVDRKARIKAVCFNYSAKQRAPLLQGILALAGKILLNPELRPFCQKIGSLLKTETSHGYKFLCLNNA